MKVIAVTGPGQYADFIVQMSRAEMARVLGEGHLSEAKAPAVGAEVKLVDAWKLVEYTRNRQSSLEQLRMRIAQIDEATAGAIELASAPLIVETKG